jgi:hypothetical protein
VLQHFLADTGTLCGARKIQLASDRISRGADGGQQAVQRGAAMLDSFEPAFSLEQLDLALEQVHGIAQHGIERRNSARSDQGVRILIRWKRGDADPNTVPK